MVVRRSVWIAGIALAAAGLTVVGGLEALAWWDASQMRQRRLRGSLARLHGWVTAAPEVTRRADAVFGSSTEEAPTAVMTLHREAAAAGVRMTEVRPQGEDVELLVEGPIASVGAYLSQLAAQRPPVRLETVNLMTQPKADAPLAARVRVSPVGRGEAG